MVNAELESLKEEARQLKIDIQVISIILNFKASSGCPQQGQ